MAPLTRRRALQGVTGLLAGLAGCPGGTDTDDRETPTEPAERPDGRNVATDPDHVVLRRSAAPSGEPVAWFADGSLETPGTTVSPEEGQSQGLIASEATAGTLALADVDGAGRARSLVEGTNFDEETLYLEEKTVGECHRLELCYVEWQRTEIETDFAEVLRDHDVRCRADVRETASVLIRVPATLDPGVVTNYGSGTHSGSCPPPPGEREELRREDDRDAPPPIGNATVGGPENATDGGSESGSDAGTGVGGDSP